MLALKHLRKAIEIFIKWIASGKTSLINEIFLACLQIMRAVPGLVKYMDICDLRKHHHHHAGAILLRLPNTTTNHQQLLVTLDIGHQ